jgi:hypothetical protein
VALSGDGQELQGVTVKLISGGAGDPTIIAGTADPSNVGVEADEGSLFLRYAGGAGELYSKIGATDTDWTQVAVGAAATSLDEAYDGAGAGAGRTITADAGAVVMTSAAADNLNVLEIVKNPAGVQSGNGVNVSMGAMAFGAGVSITTGAADGNRGLVITQTPVAYGEEPGHILEINGGAHTGINEFYSNITEIRIDLQRPVNIEGFSDGDDYIGVDIVGPQISDEEGGTLSDATSLYVNAPSQGANIDISNLYAIQVGRGLTKLEELELFPATVSGGSAPSSTLYYRAPTMSNITGASEITDVRFALSRTVNRVSGNASLMRAMRIEAPTHTSDNAVVITRAVTVAISGAPVAGTLTTITNPYAFHVESGVSKFDGAAGTLIDVLSDVANIATNARDSNVFTVTLTATRILDNPTNLIAGFTYLWIIVQSTGGHGLTYGTVFDFPGGTAPTLSAGAGAVDLLCGVYDGTNILCNFTADYQ